MMKGYIGNKAFYRRVLTIAVPIVIQNGITNFVSLLDNIMVGQVGTIPMSGVSIANQLFFIFNLTVFGACGGAGIFTAQFYGREDHNGVRYTFRYKYLISLLLSLLGIGIFLYGGESLLGMYLQGEGDPLAAAQTLQHGMSYLKIMLWGLVPFAIATAYSTTLRESGQTVVPMAAGVAAVLVNLGLNFILIFGHLGFRAMGADGAAIATVISRYVELAIVAGWTHLHKKDVPFIKGAYRSLHIPKQLLWSISKKGIPLMLNEFCWSAGVAVLNQCYSTCGLDVVPALNISSTIQNLSNVANLALANAVGIIMGQMLGAGKSRDDIEDANRKLFGLAILLGFVFGGVLMALSGAFPQLYNTSDSVRQLAGTLIRITALLMPVMAYSLTAYFTLRSGGQAFITFIFDSCFMWVCAVSLAFCLSRFTALSIIPLYTICQGTELLKCVIGTWLVKKGTWIKNLTQ